MSSIVAKYTNITKCHTVTRMSNHLGQLTCSFISKSLPVITQTLTILSSFLTIVVKSVKMDTVSH